MVRSADSARATVAGGMPADADMARPEAKALAPLAVASTQGAEGTIGGAMGGKPNAEVTPRRASP